MSIRKRGKIWHCEWQIGGQRVAETTGTTDREAAQEYHDRRRAEIWRQKKLGDTRVITWDEAALSWVDEHAIHKRSFETDRQRLGWLTEHLTGMPVTAITTDALIAIRKTQIKKGNSPATANRYLAVISAVINYAHQKGHLPGVPSIPYLQETSKDFFLWITPEQARALIAELPPHLALMTRFALATGLRRANITGLLWQDIDINRRVTWIWAGSAKGKKHFPVPLNDDALAVLKECAGQNARYVFTYRDNAIFHATTKAWFKACGRVGIDPAFTFHDLRHTWASWHVMAGTPLPVLQQLGAWQSMDMVMRYAHLAPGYVANYAGNVALDPANLRTEKTNVSEHSRESLEGVGWLMGLEPTTTGITILKQVKKIA